MLLDSASMYYRAFYGVPDRFRNAEGTPVNAVRGFTDVIARLVTRFDPDWMVACWDDDWRPQFRVDLVPAYKAHRVTGEVGEDEDVPDDLEIQVPIIIDVLRAFGIARVGSAGFEADDVIAQFAREHDGPVDIVTGDRDLFQLVEPVRPTRVIYPARGFANLEEVDDAWLLRKYRVTGAQYADFSLMRGDSSDGLPGVRGVGEKTAASLMQAYETISEILSAAEDPGSGMTSALRRKMLDSRDYLSRADPVVRLNHAVPVPEFDPTLPYSPVDAEGIQRLAEVQNLNSPVARLTAALRSRIR